MAERGSNDKSNKTLRACLVYDYILKKADSDTFQLGKLNAYLESYGINCDNRAIMRDVEAIIMKNLRKVNNIVLIGLLIDVLNRHLRVKVFIEIQVALPIMIDSSFSQIPLPTIL